MKTIVSKTTLINEDYFKANCPVPLNFNIDEIKPFFNIAERLWVEPLLGSPLYEELLKQVEDNDITEVNSTLLLELYPYLAMAICFEALPFLMYHVSEVGITKGKSENSESITSHDVNYINSHLRTQVETLKNGVKDFLERHAVHYPLYKKDGDCHELTTDDFYYEGYEGMDKYTLAKILNNHMKERNKPNTNLKLYPTKRYTVRNN